MDLTDPTAGALGRGAHHGDSLADAVAWCGDPAALDAILPLVAHTDPAVRRAVAGTLPRLTRAPRPSDVVAALLTLTADADPDVRDTACHSLGLRVSEVDTPEVRDALAARLYDSHRETACEALLGLARRHDPRVLPVLRHRLSGDDVRLTELMAAGATGDPSLHVLVRAQLTGWPNEVVPKVCAALRLTDPDGVGEDLLDGLAAWYALPGGRRLADRYWWSVALNVLEQAPHRTEELAEAVHGRIAGDGAAVARFLASTLGRAAAARGWRP